MITIFKPDGIGDFVLATGCIRQIINSIGNQKIELIVNELVMSLARHQFPECLIIPLMTKGGGFQENWQRFPFNLQRLWRRREILICLRHHRDRHEQMLLAACRAKKIYLCDNGFRLENFCRASFWIEEKMINHCTTVISPYPNEQLAPYDRCVSWSADVTVLNSWARDNGLSETAPLPFLSGFEITELPELYVSPYSSTVHRDYPNELLAEALADFVRQYPMKVVLCGSPVQLPRLQQLQKLMNIENCLFTPDSLVDFARGLAQAGGILSVDTGTAHIATAMDKRAVILLGKYSGKECVPWQKSQRQRWLYKLDKNGYKEILTSLTPQEISAALLEVMADGKGKMG